MSENITNLVILDSSFLVALLLPRDKFHSRSKEMFLENRTATYILSDYVIDEIMTLIRNRTNNCQITTRAVKEINKLISDGIFEFYKTQEADFTSAQSIFVKYCDQLISFTDSTILVLHAKFNADSIFSFDENLLLTANLMNG